MVFVITAVAAAVTVVIEGKQAKAGRKLRHVRESVIFRYRIFKTEVVIKAPQLIPMNMRTVCVNGILFIQIPQAVVMGGGYYINPLTGIFQASEFFDKLKVTGALPVVGQVACDKNNVDLIIGNKFVKSRIDYSAGFILTFLVTMIGVPQFF